jgi:hypothetical protein
MVTSVSVRAMLVPLLELGTVMWPRDLKWIKGKANIKPKWVPPWHLLACSPSGG